MLSEVIVVSPTSGNALEMKAVALLQELQPGVLLGEGTTNVELIFDYHLPKLGIESRYEDLTSLPGGNVLGFTYSNGKRKCCLVEQSLLDGGPSGGRRLRATIGHEVGHALLHLPSLHMFRSACNEQALEFFRRDASQIKPYVNPEWQAWRFAGALLMPRRVFEPLVAKGLNEHELAEHFDVNPAFIKSRLKQLKLTDDRRDYAF